MEDRLRLEVRRPGREPSVFQIEPGIYTVGSDDDCRIRLAHQDVESRHAILTVSPDGCSIEDLASRTGTRLGDEPVQGRAAMVAGQKVRIGPFELALEVPGKPAPPPQAPEAAPPAGPPAAPSEPAPPVAADLKRTIKQQIHRELVQRMDIKRLAASHIDERELRKRALATIKDIVSEVQQRLPPGVEPESLTREICDEALGLGPLEGFLQDPEITEIMVNGHAQVYVERSGKLVLTDQTFMDNASVMAVIERIVSPLGRRIDESQPYVDARLPDGSRVNAIIHPLSLIGPCLTIRKFSKTPFTDSDLIRLGTMTESVARLLKTAVQLRKNIIVSGGTGSGKTTFLNVLSNYLPGSDRIVTIEDAAELRLGQAHLVRLEARPPNIEGRGAVTIRDLVRNALRMRPDRIVVGECRGGEALDMLQAMNTGHDGSLTTVHANSPRDVISRLETMVLMSGMELPVRAIREQIAAAIDMVVHTARLSDGTRRVTTVTEIVGQEGDQITMQDIFDFKQEGLDERGKVLGELKPTGSVPTFMGELRAHGLSLDHAIFDPLQPPD